jgi:nucleotide-binding universal stress UspA family protein
MKTVLVPVERNDLIESSLATAVLLARSFGSYVEGFALSPELNTLMAAEGMGSIVVYPTDLGQQDQANAAEARKLFEAAMQKAGVAPATATPVATATYGWNDRPTPGDSFVGSYGRVFDVTVVGRPGSKVSSPHMSTLETALFESGRPVLIAPPQAPSRMGEVVTIAWNGSTESARTIAFAMPVLKRAKRVVVLTVEDTGVPGPTGEEVARQLRRNEVSCEAVTAKIGSRSSGAAMLDEAMAAGSDLLVKGAYTQSRLRQMIFGGATSHIIAEAQLPVLMAH